MSFLDKMLGRGRYNKELASAMEKIRRIVEDEDYQNGLLGAELRAVLESRPVYDKSPLGEGAFGYNVKNPIPVNGPIGQLAYLSKLVTMTGERILFHRVGAVNEVDVFEAVTFSGSEWFLLFLDLYHPRKSRLAPDGFQITSKPVQISGFNNYCSEFPYDFIKTKRSANPLGIAGAYIPDSAIEDRILMRSYKRDVEHMSKVELIMATITSGSLQEGRL